MLVVIITINYSLKRKHGLLLLVSGSFTILTTCGGNLISFKVKKYIRFFYNL